MMNLYYRSDLLLKDAAKALGITEQAAKSRLMRARKLLRRSFNAPWNAPRESSKQIEGRSDRVRQHRSSEGPCNATR
jgi:hypothetical protein